MPISSQPLGQSNDDFHESPHGLSRHGGRLLMWKIVFTSISENLSGYSGYFKAF